MQHEINRESRLVRAVGKVRRSEWVVIGLLLVAVCDGLHAAPKPPTQPAASTSVAWQDADIATPTNGVPGWTRIAAKGRFIMQGLGEDLNHVPTAQLHFHYIPFQGDFEITTRVIAKTVMDRWESRAGIMIRQSLEPGTPYTFLYFAKQHVEALRCDAQGQTRFAFSHVEGKKPPIWLKLARWHGTITAYYSEDGQNWTTMNREAPIVLPSNALIGLAVSHGAKTGATTAAFDQVYAGPLRLPYKTSWVGNSFGGGDRWIQDHIAAMYVAPDGTCYTQAEWDEGGRNSGIYRNGNVIGSLEGSCAVQGGTAIAGDGKIIYLGTVFPGTKLPAVRRFHLDGTHASFPGGAGDGSYILVEPTATITALAVGNGRLYVADGQGNHIYAYDPVTGAARHDWPCEDPHTLTVDPHGNVWVNQRVQGHAVVHCFTSEGADTGRQIEGLVDPGGLAIDNQGRLLVAENGPDQQVRIYGSLDSTPRLVDTFGAKGGVYSDVPGEVKDQKLPPNIVGLGADGSGNLYVGGDGWSWSGVDIRKYTPAGAMKWRLLGLEGVIDFGDIDPVTQADFYSEQEHFTLDFSKSQGQEWSYEGFTVDPFAFPDDPRLHIDAQSTMVRYLKDNQGQRSRFLFQTNNWGSYMIVYRFDPDHHGEIAIPCMMLADGLARTNKLVAWPPFQPKNTPWIWRDTQGEGKIRPEDLSPLPTQGRGWDIDANGDLWQAGRNIYYYKYLGLDGHGVPKYAEPQKIAPPAPFTDLSRIKYLPETDTLYLSGFTVDHPNHPYNGFPFVGTEVARYNHWHRGGQAPVWRIVVPHDDITGVAVTEALDIAGDFVFAVENFNARVHVYDAKTGKEVTALTPGPEVASQSGWIDMPYALHAFHRSNGEYLVFVEEDYQNKVLMYRWFPQGAPYGTGAETDQSQGEHTGLGADLDLPNR